MKAKNVLTSILILIGLAAATTGAYTFSHFFLSPSLPAGPGLPPLLSLDLPPQTQNGFTAILESYYADASRLVFRVRVAGGDGFLYLDRVSLKDERGEEINASMGVGPADESDLSLYQIELNPVTPLADRLKAKLGFAVVTSPGNGDSLAQFSFALDLPVHPALTFNPKQTIFANGLEILLDRVIITPAHTQAYLCYNKPSDADWMIGREATLKIRNQKTSLYEYSLLSDSAFSEGDKGGEPGWTPPVQTGRCVKVGFPIGDINPQSITLTIPALEQSMPEVIPPDEVKVALETLKKQGIEMTYESFSHGNTWEFQKLPPGMNEQQAFRKFIEALGYLYKGPWVFDLQLGPQVSFPPQFSTSFYGAPTPIPLPTIEPRIAAELPGRIRSFDISPDLRTIAFATSQGVVLYDLESYKHLRTLNESESVYKVAWSPDGGELASGDIVRKNSEFGKSHLVVWDTSNWQVAFEESGTDETLDSIYGDIAWSPDSQSLADSINGMGVLVHDIGTGEIISQQETLSAYEISWSPDGSRLVSTGDLAYGIRRWKVSTDESVRLFDQRASSSLRIAWSPDGERIASGHAEGRVCFWTATTNKCDGFIRAHQGEVFSLAWSPDGNQLATGRGVIRIWDSHTGQLITSFGQNDGSVYTHLEWPTINQPLVSSEAGYASEGLTIVRFWDVDTGKILFEFHGASGLFGE
jgi:hypothetical protein